MADYRLLYADWPSGALLGELDAITVSAVETLNAAGSLTATVALDPDTAAPKPAGARNAVYLERDGVILWGGVLWAFNADVAAQTVELGASGFHSYFLNRRHIRTRQSYNNVEQATIARGFITAAQSVPNGDIGVELDSTVTGVSRVRVYEAFERKPVGEALEQLCAVENGMDFRYRTDRSGPGGAIATTLDLTYPAQGRVTDHVFEVGVNCTLLTYSEDATAIVTTVDALGAGEGDDMLIVTANNPILLASYPLLEDVIDFKDVSRTNTLASHAARRLARGAGPVRHVEISVFPDTIPTLGSYVVGDQVHVRVDYGWVQLNERFRIVEQTLDLADGGETVRLALAGLETFEDL